MSKNVGIQRPIKFVISGGMAAGAEYVSFLLFSVIFGFEIIFSNILSFIIGFLISFLLNKTWVFTNKNDGHKQILYYSILAIANLTLSSGSIWLLVNVLSSPGYIAKILVMAMVATWNYFVFSTVIFKEVIDRDGSKV